MTRQRQVVLEELQAVPCHPSADELYQRVRQRLPHISLGTVYRNLELLVEEGRAIRLDSCGQRRYDGTVRPHYHVRCCRCGRAEDVELAGEPQLRATVSAQSGYEITGHRLEFTGICPACRALEGGQ